MIPSYTKLIDRDTNTIYYVNSDYFSKRFGNVENFWAVSDLQKVAFSETVIKKNQLLKCRGMLENVFDCYVKNML